MRKRHHWSVKILWMVLIGAIAVTVFGQAVMQLWNWLMPSIFGLHPISFWQAIGLMVLSWILLGRLGHGPRFGQRRWHGLRERWAQMTPEQRDEFLKGLEGGCGSRFGRRAPEAGA